MVQTWREVIAKLQEMPEEHLDEQAFVFESGHDDSFQAKTTLLYGLGEDGDEKRMCITIDAHTLPIEH